MSGVTEGANVSRLCRGELIRGVSGRWGRNSEASVDCRAIKGTVGVVRHYSLRAVG